MATHLKVKLDGKGVRLLKQYTTYMPMLIKTVQLTDGAVMELGAGIFSTPLLHWLCQEKRRQLVTYEHVPQFYDFAKQFQSGNHSIRFVKDWENIDIKTHWSVVLVDHITERRHLDAIRLKDKADYIILHDTDSEGRLKYNKAWPHFKYRYDWKRCRPWTTVLSNFKDLSLWK